MFEAEYLWNSQGQEGWSQRPSNMIALTLDTHIDFAFSPHFKLLRFSQLHHFLISYFTQKITISKTTAINNAPSRLFCLQTLQGKTFFNSLRQCDLASQSYYQVHSKNT